MNTSKQTSKENAGLQNFNSELLAEYKDEEAGALLAMIAPIFKKSIGSPTQNRRGNWEPDDLRQELADYFTYFAENGLKPSKASIRLWLNVSPARYYEWENNPSKYGEVYEIIALANDVLETQYVNRGEKHPTMNTFLLKASHGYRDTQNIEVTATSKVEKGDIDSAIERLKLEEDSMEIIEDEVIKKEIE
ncbi:MAG TPA: terminase small subunit [Tissierellaceae bacterium]|nr:terminase small subunit [Tissierellaceae bacterium]